MTHSDNCSDGLRSIHPLPILKVLSSVDTTTTGEFQATPPPLQRTHTLIIYSVKRSDVTGNRFEWQLGEKSSYVRPPPPYFIVLASSVTTMEAKAIEFHIIGLLPTNLRYPGICVVTTYHPHT